MSYHCGKPLDCGDPECIFCYWDNPADTCSQCGFPLRECMCCPDCGCNPCVCDEEETP